MDAQYTGEQISRLRKQKNLTQRQLAEQLHVTDKAVSKWERGVNFPDLGLMEKLAEALDTTTAVLLGLEQADQAETLSALAEISQDQLEEARKDLRIFSWGSVATALLLALAYQLTQKHAVEVYCLLHCMIFAIGYAGQWYLYKYGEMKKWEPKELGTFFASLLPVIIWVGYMFFTGNSLSQGIVWLLVAISCVFAQIHFIQVMRPRIMQALPLILSTLYVLYQLLLGGLDAAECIPAICCLVVLAVDIFRQPKKWRVSWKSLGAGLSLILVAVALVGTLCYDSLVRSYVHGNREKLESYAQNLLETGKYDTYGPWNVIAYPEHGYVEFTTGGSGMGSNTVYEGFYYSVSGEHLPFPGFDGHSEIVGSTAWFRDSMDNSDNWQKSTQISEYLYWFELHY